MTRQEARAQHEIDMRPDAWIPLEVTIREAITIYRAAQLFSNAHHGTREGQVIEKIADRIHTYLDSHGFPNCAAVMTDPRSRL